MEEVSVTGSVKPISDLDLSFETGGQVAHVNVSVGDKVYAGQSLISLSNDDLVAVVQQAEAGLKIAQANLSSLEHGSTPEQIAVNESQVDKAKSDISDAKTSLINSLRDAYTKSDDSIRNYTDLMFSEPRSQNPKLLFETDFQLKNELIDERINIEKILTAWSISVENLNINSDFDAEILTANDNLVVIQNFLQNLAFGVNKLSSDSSLSQTTLTLWKTNISNVRASISLALSNLASLSSQYKSSVSSLKIAESQLSLQKTGATDDALNAQRAAVDQAQANLNSAKAKLSKTIIYAPITGVITNLDAKVGQTIQAGLNAVSLISYGQYEVESYVPEADIAKVKIGQIATTTLDAYGSDVYFTTEVFKIDPAETINEGVPTYKITLKFSSSTDTRIKSGMTANLDILTAQKTSVLAVPSRSVFTIDDQKYVKLVNANDNTKTTDVMIQTGLRGESGYVEIISGLKEGDKILASPNF